MSMRQIEEEAKCDRQIQVHGAKDKQRKFQQPPSAEEEMHQDRPIKAEQQTSREMKRKIEKPNKLDGVART